VLINIGTFLNIATKEETLALQNNNGVNPLTFRKTRAKHFRHGN
jgi:hypothetical protein